MSVRPQNMPFLFARHRDTKVFPDLKPNKPNSTIRVTYFVKLARLHDMKYYDSSWMDCEYLGESKRDEDLVLVPDVDITEEVWMFDSEDAAQSYRDAMTKMKELWSALDIV